MTSKLTRERLQEIAEDGFLKHGESKELARLALAAMDSEPAIADCDPEVYEKGVSVCLVAIPKETAEIICQNITAATGCKVDWHYFGGRVHIKALRESSQPAPVVQDDFDFDRFNDVVWLECVARNPHMHSPTTSTIARVALELNKRMGGKNSPVIPDGSASMLQRWLAFGRGMQNAGCQLPHNLIAETESMLAAAPQEVDRG